MSRETPLKPRTVASLPRKAIMRESLLNSIRKADSSIVCGNEVIPVHYKRPSICETILEIGGVKAKEEVLKSLVNKWLREWQESN